MASTNVGSAARTQNRVRRTTKSRHAKQGKESSSACSARHKDLETLAREQGVKPVTNFEDLIGDFWPEDENIEEFLATIRKWRCEDGRMGECP